MSGWDPDNTAAAVRVRARVQPPWDLYLERARRYEVHLNGPRVEMRRGPVTVSGFGLRVFRRAGERLGQGSAASTDDSPASVDEAIRNAEATAPISPTPAKEISLPGNDSRSPGEVALTDQTLSARPEETIQGYVHALLEGVDHRGGVVPSFGSVRASLAEVAVVNSAGLSRQYAHTLVETELALKASGGPEGPPAGEYWVNQLTRSVPVRRVSEGVREWCQRAQDVRRAVPVENGLQNVLFPTPVLAEILPPIIGFRFCGMAAVQKMAPPCGTEVASGTVSVVDDGLVPMALGSAPFDDEGTAKGRTALIEGGRAENLVVDQVHAAALNLAPTGSGFRGAIEYPTWYRFASGVGPRPSTLVLPAGSGGSIEELAEVAGEGVWIDQLGWASPDGVTSAFGGEIRLGYRIRGGKRAEPIRGGTVGGFALGPSETPPMLSAVSAIGSRAELVGRLSSPPFLVQGFPVAGA